MLGIRIETSESESGWVYFHRRGPQLWRVVLLLGVLSFSTVFSGFLANRFLRQHVNEWSAQNHLARGQLAWDAGEFGVALNRAGSALAIEPGLLDALRLRHLAGVKTLDQQVLHFGDALISRPRASPEMKAEVLRTFLDFGGARLFSEAWEKWTGQQERDLEPFQLLQLEFLAKSGQLPQFFTQLGEIRAQIVDGSVTAYQADLLEIEARLATGIESDGDKADTLALLLLDRVLSARPGGEPTSIISKLIFLLDSSDPRRWKPEVALSLRDRLRRLPEGVDGKAADSLDDTLRLAGSEAGLPLLPFPESGGRDWLPMEMTTTTEGKVRTFKFKPNEEGLPPLIPENSGSEGVALEAVFGQRATHLAREMTLHEIVEERRSQGKESQLAAWLLRHREALKVLDLWEQAESIRSSEFYLAVMEALILVERYEEFHWLAKFPPRDVSRLSLEVFRALAFSAEERDSEAVSAWQQAMQLAELDFTRNNFLWLSRVALDAGEENVALEAIVGASKHPLGVMPEAVEIEWVVPVLVERGRFNDLLTVTKRLMRFDSSPVLINNAFYIGVVTGNGEGISEEILSRAARLAEENPSYPQIRNTAALLHALAGRGEDALAFYHDYELGEMGWHEFSQVRRATLALVLRANGFRSPWKKIRLSIDWSKLSPPERKFFREHLPEPEEESEKAEES